MDSNRVPQQKRYPAMLEGSAELLELCAGPVIPFAEWGLELSHCKIEKVAEATFAEVYEYTRLGATLSNVETDRSVLKIIPLRTLPRVMQTSVDGRRAQILSELFTSEAQSVAKELKIMRAMSSTQGFAQFKGVRVVQGRPPTAFCSAYRAWNAEQQECSKRGSSFPDPASPGSYPDHQLWAVIEMAYAGDSLEDVVDDSRYNNVWSTWDIFWQLCLSLARGERLQFEHRDLHFGNVCVQPRTPVVDPERKMGFSPLQTTIIDYGLSRCSLPGGEIIAHDLSRVTGLFEGDGRYQYDIYRYMRDSIMEKGEAEEQVGSRPTTTVWHKYQPRTNLIWLHLTLEELMRPPRRLLADFPPLGAPESPAWEKKAESIWKVLDVLSDWLCPNTVQKIQSASDLVEEAIQRGWIDSCDVL